MPGLIQRVPVGYLDLFGLKSSGQTPTVSPDECQPVVDITELYAAARWEQITATTNTVNLIGFWGAAALTVPSGEMWLVDRLTYTTGTLLAGTTYRLRPGMIASQSGSQPIAVGDPSQTWTAAERPFFGWGDIIARAGDQLGLVVDSLTLGTALTFDIRCRFLRLLV